MQHHFAVIMAGGVGSRFWPESTGENPKQFLDLTGTGKSLLRQTFDRIRFSVPTENIYILTNRRYLEKNQAEIPEIAQEQIVSEPVMRNTAPAILYAANKIFAKNPNGVMAVLPSDHFIGDEKAFREDMQSAMDYAFKNNYLLTLGIQPASPHTGYGYIEYDKNDTSEFKKVLRFVEKPDRETAVKYLQAGNFLWNAGIFIWKAGTIREAFKKFLPGMFEKMKEIPYNTVEEVKHIEEVFPQLENISVDYGIMEKAENVRVKPVSFGWNDLGSWDSLYKQLSRNAEENVSLNSTLFSRNSSGNLIKTQGKKVILSGLKDYLIIDSGDVLMIIPRSESQEVKHWREKVKKNP